MENIKFKGIIPALVSPLNEDGSVREEVLRRLVKWQLDAGCSGFYLCGTTGEGMVMKPESRKAMTEIVIDEVKGKCSVISHVGAIDLRTAVDLAKHASDAGVDAISSVPPAYFNYGQSEILQYYTALSEASGVPVLIYAAPLGNSSVTVELVQKAMEIKNVIGLKWTSSNYFEMRMMKELNNGDINVLNGADETLLCGLVMGADGGIGATYNIMPGLFVRLYESYMKGDLPEAQKMQYGINRVIHVLIKYGVLNGVKDALQMIGFDTGYCTYPLKRFTDEEQKAFRHEITELNFMEPDYVCEEAAK